MVINFNSSEITATSRATSGVKGIALKDGDSVIAALPVRHKADDLAVFSETGLGKKMKLAEFISQKRGGKGLIGYKGTSATGPLVGAALVADDDTILFVGDKNSICTNATEIPLLSRASIGNQMIKTDKLMSVSKI